MKKTDLMIDLETWGNTPTAVIRAIAIAEFDPATELISKTLLIDARGSIDDQIEHRRTIDLATVDWWAKQDTMLSDSIRQPTHNTRFVKTIYELAFEALRFFNVTSFERIWSRGNYDLPILASLIQQATEDTSHEDESNRDWCPWSYRQQADVRTLDYLTTKPTPYIPHHPLSDVKAQIHQVHQAYLLRAEKPQ